MVEIPVRFVHMTEKAILVEHYGEEHWFPKSQIKCRYLECELEDGDEIEIGVPEWILRQKGISRYETHD